MKALAMKDSGAVVAVFNDDRQVFLLQDSVQVGDPVEYYIGFCNSENSKLYENVTPPAGLQTYEYVFDGSSWSLNPAVGSKKL